MIYPDPCCHVIYSDPCCHVIYSDPCCHVIYSDPCCHVIYSEPCCQQQGYNNVLSPLNNSNDNNTLPPESLLDFASVSDEIVSKIIRNSPVKSCSLDPLPTHVLKHTKHLVTFITNSVNKSIITGTFPSSFKRALVSPLIK